MRHRMDTDPRLTTKQAADYLKKAGFPVSKPTLERYRAKGTGPVYLRIAKRVFYPQSALDKFVSGTPVYPTHSKPSTTATG
ncbi:MAG: DNA-binding protein [Candidatus Electrothrix sp. AW1]|nr:DNA-binding protein [Candidatus Electrothrix sp. AX1]MCI5183027.1 DNA-binding protein [Candidatus Electrothrix gigas]